MPGIKRLIISCTAASLLTGCELINKPEEIPAYLRLNEPVPFADTNGLVASPLGVKDYWLYQGPDIQGIYQPPTVIPVLPSKGSDLRLVSGIYESGQSGFRLPYPFFQDIYPSVTLTAGDTADILPVLKYRDDTEISVRINEDFEGSSINFRPFYVQFTDTIQLRRSNTEVIFDSLSGHILFDGTHKYFEVISDSPDPMEIPRNIDCYAEITYKNDFPIAVGLAWKDFLGNSGGKSGVVVLEPRDEWNTVYVHLTQLIRENTVDNVNFHLWLQAQGDGSTGDIYIDNVRLIHFK